MLYLSTTLSLYLSPSVLCVVLVNYTQLVFVTICTLCCTCQLHSACICRQLYSVLYLSTTLSLYLSPSVLCVVLVNYTQLVFVTICTLCCTCQLHSACICHHLYSVLYLSTTLSLYLSPSVLCVVLVNYTQLVFVTISTLCCTCQLHSACICHHLYSVLYLLTTLSLYLSPSVLCVVLVNYTQLVFVTISTLCCTCQLHSACICCQLYSVLYLSTTLSLYLLPAVLCVVLVNYTQLVFVTICTLVLYLSTTLSLYLSPSVLCIVLVNYTQLVFVASCTLCCTCQLYSACICCQLYSDLMYGSCVDAMLKAHLKFDDSLYMYVFEHRSEYETLPYWMGESNHYTHCNTNSLNYKIKDHYCNMLTNNHLWSFIVHSQQNFPCIHNKVWEFITHICNF